MIWALLKMVTIADILPNESPSRGSDGPLRRRFSSHEGLGWLIAAAIPIAFLAIFLYYPVASSFWLGLATQPKGFLQVLSNPLNIKAVWASLQQAVLSCISSLILGYIGGVIMARYSFPGRRTFRAIVIVPFMMPSIVVIIGFLSLYGKDGIIGSAFPLATSLSSGLSGIVAVNTYYNAPLIMYLVSAAIERTDPEVEQASKIFGGKRSLFIRKIIMPQTSSGVASGVILTFIYSFMGFTIPLVIGGPAYSTVEVQVYSLFYGFLDFGGAAALAAFQMLCLSALSYLYIRTFLSRAERIRPIGATRIRLAKLDFRRRPFESLAVSLYLLLISTFLFSPMVAVAYSSIHDNQNGMNSLGAYGAIFSAATRLGFSATGAILNSLFYAFMTTVGTIAVCILASYSSRRTLRRPFLYDLIISLPMTISPITIALGLYISLEPIPPFDMIWPLILCSHIMAAIPLAMRFLTSSFSRIPRELLDAASTLGSRTEGLFRVELPLIRGGLVSAAAFAFSTSLGEFAATNFLYAGRYVTMNTAIYQFLRYRMSAAASAMAMILVGFSIFSFLVFQLLGEERSLGGD